MPVIFVNGRLVQTAIHIVPRGKKESYLPAVKLHPGSVVEFDDLMRSLCDKVATTPALAG